jgi:DNA-binding CsgD family transcriptional regulator/tetratricopeptide (TPR) repeat protein
MLIERDEPLESLLGAARRAAAGQGGVAIVGGEAGIGKTSLLREFARHVGKNHRVFWGGCEALVTPRPFGPLQDMAPALDPRVAALLEQTEVPGRLLPTLLQVLQEARDATILVFEDVHWADDATLDLVKYLGRRIPLLRAMLVLSLRSDEVGADHPLTQVFGDLPVEATVRISLQPLSPAAVAVLACKAGHSGVDLHRITAGNPFFVTEILAGGEAGSGRIPPSIRDAVWARLARLPAGEREVLEIMSIVPGSVEPWLMRGLLGREADAAVEGCVARGLLVRDGPGALSFRHELARRATLDRLTPPAQQSLHARIEAVMSDSAVAPADLSLSRRVHHAAGADDGARVLDLAPRAAAQAARLGAHRQAAAHLATALRYVAEAPNAVAAQLHEDWAYEAGLALRIDDSVVAARHRAIALWRELERPDKVGHNLRWLARLCWYRGESRLAMDYIDQAVRELESLPPGPELAMAYSGRSQLHMLDSRVDDAVEWGLRAIALAEQLGDIETRIHALNNVGSALLSAGRPGGQERLDASRTLALQHGFHEHAARAYLNSAEHAVLFKDFALAERILVEAIAFDTRHDLDSLTHYLVGRQAELRLEQGRLREAETIAQGVIGLERATLVMKLPAIIVLGRVRMRLGEAAGAELLQRTLKDALAIGEPQNIVPVRLALAEAAWLAEDVNACHTQLDELAAIRPDSLNPWQLGELATWWRRSGMARPFPLPTASIAEPRAVELGGDPLAAAAEWTRLGLPYEAALALTQVSGSEAGPALARAVSIFESIEARAAAAWARRLARRLGVAAQLPKARRGPYASARSHPLGLTRRELEVLDLIARGLSNKEIARRLMRSPRTIENQVSVILSKFKAGSRMDVVLRLRGEPWLLASVEPQPAREP